MKLEKFNEKDSKKKSIVLFTVVSVFLLTGVFFYTSFAVYEDIKTFNILSGTIPDIGEALYVYHLPDGTVTTLSSRVDSSLVLDETNSTCNYGVVPKWVNGVISLDKTSATNTANQKIRCEAYMVEYSPTAAETILALVSGSSSTSTAVIDNGTDESGCSNTLAYDDFGNLRYVGANPCNYITFNSEAPTVTDAYQAYLDGAVPTNYTGEYDTEEACMADIEDMTNYLGIEETLSCSLNTSNNKYEIIGHGYLNALRKETTQSGCSNVIDDSGLTSSTITCRKNGKMATGGWRIIGVFGDKIKIIRNESIGEYSWDSSASRLNSGYGVNQWGESEFEFSLPNSTLSYTGADLMKLLNPGYETNLAEDSSGNEIEGTYANNSLYWNRASGNCYYGPNNAYTTCDFSTTGLTENAKSMIASATWNLGSQGENDVETSGNGLGLASKFYEYERSTNTGDICVMGTYANERCDPINRTTSWEGYVGLMSPSDYGYAVGGDARTNCLANTNLSEYGHHNGYFHDCYYSDWLYSSQKSKILSDFTMSPYASDGNSDFVFIVGRSGWLGYDVASSEGLQLQHEEDGIMIRPVVFLIPTIKISGQGTLTEPFTIETE